MLPLQPGQVAFGFEVVSELGSGAFATVYTVIDRRAATKQQQQYPSPPPPLSHSRPSLFGSRSHAHVAPAPNTVLTPTPLALKVISKRDQDPEQLALTRLEVSIHASVPRHPNIVRLLEWHEDADALYLVLERCDYGDLFDLVLAPPATPANTPVRGFSLAPASGRPATPTPTRAGSFSRRGLPDAVVLRYMAQIASALAACHSVGVFHRDLKPENVLLAGPLDAQGYPLVARLADFGLATRESFSLELGLGTRSYLAPECLDDRLDGYVSAPADVFALALVILQVAHPGVRLWKATVAEDRDWCAFVQAVHEQRRAAASGSAPMLVRGGGASAAANADPVMRHLASRHPQLSVPLRRLLVRALDPAPARRATLPEFQRLLSSCVSFSCEHTPSLLVTQHEVRTRLMSITTTATPSSPSSPTTPMSASSSSLSSASPSVFPHMPLSADAFEMDFNATMGHHSDHGDDRSAPLSAPMSVSPSTSQSSDSTASGFSDGEFEVSLSTPPPAAILGKDAKYLPKAAAAALAKQHLHFQQQQQQQSPLARFAVEASAAAAAVKSSKSPAPPVSRPSWTSALASTPVSMTKAPTAKPTTATHAGSGGVDWSSLDDDEDDFLTSPFGGNSSGSTHSGAPPMLFSSLKSPAGGGGTGSVPAGVSPLALWMAGIKPAPVAAPRTPSPAIGVDPATATSVNNNNYNNNNNNKMDALHEAALPRQESLDSALGVSVARLHI